MTPIVIRAIIEMLAGLSGEVLKQLQAAVNDEMKHRMEKPNGL